MIREGKTVLAAAVATIMFGASAHADHAAASSRNGYAHRVGSGVVSIDDIQQMRAASNGLLLAVGRVDAVNRDESEVVVLGQVFRIVGTESAGTLLGSVSVGDSIALIGDQTPEGYFAYSGVKLTSQYVPGASSVYLAGRVTSVEDAIGEIHLGGLRISSYSARSVPRQTIREGDLLEVFGTQPLPGGAFLAEMLEVGRASLGTGKANASVGTGKVDASVGTGK